MKTVNLSASLRDKTGRGPARRERINHKIPGVIYGRDFNNLLVEFSEMDLNNVIKEYGEHAVVDVNINGSRVKTMIKEIQREPVNRVLTHVDMKLVKDNEVVHADIPVMLKGEDFVRGKGGIVQKQLGSISVEAIPDELPKFFTADISNLNIGDKFTVGDIEFGSEITIATDLDAVIANITTVKEKEKNLDQGEVMSLDNTTMQ